MGDNAPLSRRSAQNLRTLLAEAEEDNDATQDCEVFGIEDADYLTLDDASFLESETLSSPPAPKCSHSSSQSAVAQNASSTSNIFTAPTSDKSLCSFSEDSLLSVGETLPTSIKTSRFEIISGTPSQFSELPQTALDNFGVYPPSGGKEQECGMDQETEEDVHSLFGPSYFWNSVEVANTPAHNTLAPSEEPTEEDMQEELEPEEEDNAEDRQTFHHESEDPIYPGAPINLWESLTAILTFVQSEHISRVGLGRLLSLIDLHLPQPNNLLKTKHSVFKILEHVDEPVELHYFCSVCYKSRKSSSELCDSCTDPARKVDFFITFSLAHQMKRLFKRPDFFLNIRYNQTRVKENLQNIEDIYDGEVYKRAENQGFTSNGITFMFNTDEVPVFKSNSYSLWPFYLVTLELHPEKRFLSENLIIAGIWGSTVKPHPNVFLVPIYKELLILKEGVNVQPYGENEPQKVTGTLVCGTCDAPATASFLNMKSHSGFYSCPFCTIKGTYIDSTVFPFVENVPWRNMGHVQRAVQDRIIFLKTLPNEEPYCGIKGPTVLSYIFANIFDSMSIDSMHCLYIGVMKQLLKLWFVDGKYQDKAKLLSEKLLEVLPPEYLQRKPQPVEKLIHLKASELRSFLYNLSIFLQDILKPDEYNHLCLFVKGVSLLNSQSISEEDLILAETLMNRFVQDFEKLYGVVNVSHNVHMCLHLPRCVKLLGPLWSFRCFKFEDINGRLLNLVHGTRHVGFQIHTNISVITHLPLMIHNLREGPAKQFCTGIKKNHRLKLTEIISPGTYCVGKFSEIGIETAWVYGILRRETFLYPSSKVLLFHRLLKYGLLFTSTLYKCNRLTSYIKYTQNNAVKYGNIVCFAKLVCTGEASKYLAIVKPIQLIPFQTNDIVFTHLFRIDKDSHDFFFQYDAVTIPDIISVLFVVKSSAGELTYFAEPLNQHEFELNVNSSNKKKILTSIH